MYQNPFATVMERELFSKYLKLMEDEEESLQSLATETLATEKMSNYNIDVEHCQDVVVNVSSMDLMKKYENFFCDGKYDSSLLGYLCVFHQQSELAIAEGCAHQ